MSGVIDTFNTIGDLLGGIVDLIKFLGNGLASFIDFIISLPSLFSDFILIIPSPLQIIISSFIGFLILIIVMKVVSHFV